MRMCFLADAGSVNTKSWVEAFSCLLGHDVHVVSINRTGEFDPSVTLHHIGTTDGTQDTRGKLGYLRSIGRVRELIRDISPDIVVGYRVASYGYVGARTGFRPLVVVAQGQYIITPRFSIPKRIFVASALREATLLHSWAPHVTERLVELGAEPDKILTLHRGIDIERFSGAGSEERVPNSFVVTRHLNRWYRIDTVLKAAAQAGREVGGLTGTVAGSGPAEEYLRDVAQEEGLSEAVRFAGRVPHEELPGLLRRSSVYVSAVPTDGVSASLLEAMATGCFPVVRDNAANRHWVEDGVNGLLVAGDEPKAYAEAMVTAFTDDELRRKAMEVNRGLVEDRADNRKNLREIEAAYASLVKARER